PQGAPGEGVAAEQLVAVQTVDLGALREFRAGALSRLRERPIEAEAAVQTIEPGQGEAGLQLAEVLPRIVGRLQVKRGEMTEQAPSALAEVRSALASGLADDALAPAATAVLNPAVIASGLALDRDDLAGPIGAAEALAVSAELPFVRWQPVPPPAIVPRRLFTEGESNQVLVIRSWVSQDPSSLVVTSGTPADYAAANAGRDATCERHLVPPKTSQLGPRSTAHSTPRSPRRTPPPATCGCTRRSASRARCSTWMCRGWTIRPSVSRRTASRWSTGRARPRAS
ncbi:MAG TPA: hypothetical protein PLF56_06470, partial [Micropruina sp.]|nr:hypothetical protein [Micropruina sp.]